MPERATGMNRSEKSAEVVVAGARGMAARHGEGPNQEDSHETWSLVEQCIRSPGNRGARWRGAVKLRLKS